MRVYLDTSVILRRLFNEPHPVADWGRWRAAYSSRIWLTEARRTVDRLRRDGRLSDADVVRMSRDLHQVDAGLHIVPVSDVILERAGEPFPTTLGTLDAIHLASALAVWADAPIDALLTHDRQLALAAASVGLNVKGIDSIP
jgi:predicted nucleic acid-binding protein